MAVSDEFLEYVLDQLSDWDWVFVRKMFGGAGLYCDEKMFALVADDVIYMKVDDTSRAKYEAAGSAPFKPFARRPAILSFYELPPDVLEDREQLIDWAKEALAVQKKGK